MLMTRIIYSFNWNHGEKKKDCKQSLTFSENLFISFYKHIQFSQWKMLTKLKKFFLKTSPQIGNFKNQT